MNIEDATVHAAGERHHGQFDDFVTGWIQPGRFDIDKQSQSRRRTVVRFNDGSGAQAT
jgi:hypothetical protein